MLASPQNYPFQLDSVALQYYPPASSLFTLLWFCITEQSLGADLASTPSTTTLLSKSPYSLLLEGEADTSSRNTSLTPYSMRLFYHGTYHTGLESLSYLTVLATRLWTLWGQRPCLPFYYPLKVTYNFWHKLYKIVHFRSDLESSLVYLFSQANAGVGREQGMEEIWGEENQHVLTLNRSHTQGQAFTSLCS